MGKDTKVAFIGDETCIEFFRGLGADIFPASTQKQAYEIIEKLNLLEYGVIFITEEVFDSELFNRYILDKKLVVLPSLKSKEGKGYQILEELIKKATGMKG
ncbi:MAG: hypothetical protein NC932_00285 [Candidatus Omnitrophica bacterium]|nr:hypothetical protein [Candidatus Omnitrophota bacterium]